MRSKALIGSVSCAILFFGLAMYLTPSDIPTIAPVRATTKTISLVASYTTYPYWNNSSPAPTITVTKGDTVNIMLSSDGSQHKLLVDFDGDGPSANGCTTVDRCSSLFMSTTSISFVANTTGSFYYYCTLHPTYMVGQFVVQNTGPDFGLTSNPSSTSTLQGLNANSTITVSSVNNFAGTIILSAAVSPSGPQASLNPSSVTLTSGGSAYSTLTVSTTASTSGYYSIPVAQGSYAINVTASSGSLSHSTTLSLTVEPTSSAPPGSSGLPLLPIAGGVIALVTVIGTVLFLRRRKH